MPNARRPDLGEFRHRLTLQRNAPTPGSTGEDVPSWSPVGTFWAAVETLSGRDLVSATQIKATINHRVTLRNNGLAIIPAGSPSVPPSMRLIYEGTSRAFYIEVAFRVGEMNEFHELWCSEDDSDR